MYTEAVEKLIASFEKLPGIGHKTAIRLAFYVLESDKSFAEEMANSLVMAKSIGEHCPMSNEEIEDLRIAFNVK